MIKKYQKILQSDWMTIFPPIIYKSEFSHVCSFCRKLQHHWYIYSKPVSAKYNEVIIKKLPKPQFSVIFSLFKNLPLPPTTLYEPLAKY